MQALKVYNSFLNQLSMYRQALKLSNYSLYTSSPGLDKLSKCTTAFFLYVHQLSR